MDGNPEDDVLDSASHRTTGICMSSSLGLSLLFHLLDPGLIVANRALRRRRNSPETTRKARPQYRLRWQGKAPTSLKTGISPSLATIAPAPSPPSSCRRRSSLPPRRGHHLPKSLGRPTGRILPDGHPVSSDPINNDLTRSRSSTLPSISINCKTMHPASLAFRSPRPRLWLVASSLASINTGSPSRAIDLWILVPSSTARTLQALLPLVSSPTVRRVRVR